MDLEEKRWPAVVRFACKNLRLPVVDGKGDEPDKWFSTCRQCNTVLTEKIGTMSAFTN